eukprot:Colp12_sorted_trinity150504_noHs@27777
MLIRMNGVRPAPVKAFLKPKTASAATSFVLCRKVHHDHYDLCVIGSGPSAQKCAIDSAKKRKRVVMIDRGKMTGGVCVHTGTIPSKTFREAVLHLTGYRHQAFYGKYYSPVKSFSLDDVLYRVSWVVRREMEIIRDQVRRNNITILPGSARFVDSNKVAVYLDKETPPGMEHWGVPQDFEVGK